MHINRADKQVVQFKFQVLFVCVLQLTFQLALKDNEINRGGKTQLNLKKEIDREQQQSYELRVQMDSLKSSISSLQRDVKQQQDANSEQKVSLRPALHIHWKSHDFFIIFT